MCSPEPNPDHSPKSISSPVPHQHHTLDSSISPAPHSPNTTIVQMPEPDNSSDLNASKQGHLSLAENVHDLKNGKFLSASEVWQAIQQKTHIFDNAPTGY